MKKSILASLAATFVGCLPPVVVHAQVRSNLPPQTTCQEAFRRGDWKGLEEAYAQYRRLGAPQAQELSQECVEGIPLSVAASDSAGWEALNRKTTGWSAGSSAHVIAQLARANALSGRARTLANSGRGWAKEDRLLKEAQATLDRVPSPERDGNWYASRLEVAKLMGAESGEVVELARKLLASDPYSMAGVEAAVRALDTERGHGDPRLVEWLAGAVMEKTTATEGASRYARVYEHASIFFLQLRRSPFETGRAQWSRLHRGFLDLEKKAPHLYRIDLHAGFACLAGDRLVTTKLLQRIGDKPEKTTWYLGPGPNWATGQHYEQCREWVTKGQQRT